MRSSGRNLTPATRIVASASSRTAIGIDTALVQQPWRPGASQHIILIHTIGLKCDTACQAAIAAGA